MTNTVAIFGATGAQGAPVVTEALAKGLNVRAVARDADKAAATHPGAEGFAAVLTDEDAIAAALDGVDAAFLHLPMPSGPDDAQNWMKAFVGAAHRVKLPLLVYVTGGPTGERFPSSVVVDGGTAGVNALLGCGIPTIVLQSAIYLENLLPPFFVPRLREEGVLDYPPAPETLRFQWTSHLDQARIAVAALQRPDLAGKAYEIGSPDALTGSELAELVADWIGRDVRFEPATPEAFGAHVGNVLNNPGVAFALTDLYGAVAKLDGDAMTVDTRAIEKTFDVKLTSVADHIASWPKD